MTPLPHVPEGSVTGLTAADLKELQARIKRLEHRLCAPMPNDDRIAVRNEYIELRDLEAAHV